MIRCYITNRKSGDIMESARRAVRDGVEYIQIREKDLAARELMHLCVAVKSIAMGTSTRVLVNDRLDVAMAAALDGVHLPGSGLPAADVRRLVSVVGVSTHTLEEVMEAQCAGADYVVYRQTAGARNEAAEQLLPRFLIGEVFGREDDDQCRIYGAVVVLTVRTSSCLSKPLDSLRGFCSHCLLRLARGRAWLV